MVGLRIPKKSAIFTGMGDLFTAIYLAWSEHGVKVYMCSVCMHVCVCVTVCRVSFRILPKGGKNIIAWWGGGAKT